MKTLKHTISTTIEQEFIFTLQDEDEAPFAVSITVTNENIPPRDEMHVIKDWGRHTSDAKICEIYDYIVECIKNINYR